MDIDFLIRRQAVTEWRDRQLFAAMSALNAAAMAARAEFEDHLKDAELLQSLIDPAGFVTDRIDAAMRGQLTARTEVLLADASAELRALDTRLASLADALAGSGSALEFPASAQPPLQRGAAETAKMADAPPIPEVLAPGLLRTARDWGNWFVTGATGVADTLSRTVQARGGMNDRLRRIAAARIDAAWMASTGDPRTIRTQLVSLIDDVAHEARSMNL